MCDTLLRSPPSSGKLSLPRAECNVTVIPLARGAQFPGTSETGGGGARVPYVHIALCVQRHIKSNKQQS
jgi:hypothetical protein